MKKPKNFNNKAFTRLKLYAPFMEDNEKIKIIVNSEGSIIMSKINKKRGEI